MKTSHALMVIVLGMLLMMGSCVPWGMGAWQGLFMEAATTLEVAPDGVQLVDVPSLAQGRPARLGLRGRVTTFSVQEEKPDNISGEVKYSARYRFPISIQVMDNGGAVLWSEDSFLAWDQGSRTISDESVASTGGTQTVRWLQDKFAAPASGAVSVRTTIGPDETYGAQLSDLKLEVYDNLAETKWHVIGGAVMLIVGLLLAITGVVLAIASAASAPVTGEAGQAGTPIPVRQRAMWIHLSGLLGFLVPFGSLIGPIVLWLVWRDEDPYLMEQGREAVNFQISIFLYALLSLLLMLVLIGFVLIFMLVIFQIVLTITGAMRASAGEQYRYPVTIRLLRP